MAQEIAKIQSLEGLVRAVDADGKVHNLKVGDELALGERVLTGVGSNAVISLSSGKVINLGANDALTLDQSVLETESFGNDAVVSDVAALQEAVLRGDITDLEATAAGAGTPGGVSLSPAVFADGGHESNVNATGRELGANADFANFPVNDPGFPNGTVDAPPAAPQIVPDPDTGAVIVTPPNEADVTRVVVTYEDEEGNEKTATAVNTGNGWTFVDDNGNPTGTKLNDGTTVDPNNGTITIPDEATKDGSTVTGVATDRAGQDSPIAEATAPNAKPGVQEIVPNDNGSVDVHLDLTKHGKDDSGKPYDNRDIDEFKIEIPNENGGTTTVVISKNPDGTWNINNGGDNAIEITPKVDENGNTTGFDVKIPYNSVQGGSTVTVTAKDDADQTTDNTGVAGNDPISSEAEVSVPDILPGDSRDQIPVTVKVQITSDGDNTDNTTIQNPKITVNGKEIEIPAENIQKDPSDSSGKTFIIITDVPKEDLAKDPDHTVEFTGVIVNNNTGDKRAIADKKPETIKDENGNDINPNKDPENPKDTITESNQYKVNTDTGSVTITAFVDNKHTGASNDNTANNEDISVNNHAATNATNDESVGLKFTIADKDGIDDNSVTLTINNGTETFTIKYGESSDKGTITKGSNGEYIFTPANNAILTPIGTENGTITASVTAKDVFGNDIANGDTATINVDTKAPLGTADINNIGTLTSDSLTGAEGAKVVTISGTYSITDADGELIANSGKIYITKDGGERVEVPAANVVMTPAEGGKSGTFTATIPQSALATSNADGGKGHIEFTFDVQDEVGNKSTISSDDLNHNGTVEDGEKSKPGTDGNPTGGNPHGDYTFDTTVPVVTITKVTDNEKGGVEDGNALTPKDGKMLTNDNTPTVEFTVENKHDTVTITVTNANGTPTTYTYTKGGDNANSPIQPVPEQEGKYTFTPNTPLADGDHTITITAKDGTQVSEPKTTTVDVDTSLTATATVENIPEITTTEGTTNVTIKVDGRVDNDPNDDGSATLTSGKVTVGTEEYTLHKNPDGTIDVMKGTEKVGTATVTNNGQGDFDITIPVKNADLVKSAANNPNSHPVKFEGELTDAAGNNKKITQGENPSNNSGTGDNNNPSNPSNPGTGGDSTGNNDNNPNPNKPDTDNNPETVESNNYNTVGKPVAHIVSIGDNVNGGVRDNGDILNPNGTNTTDGNRTNLTNDARPTVEFKFTNSDNTTPRTDIDKSTITLVAKDKDGNTIQTITTGFTSKGNGVYSVEIPQNLSDGKVTFEVSGSDYAGQTSNTASSSVTVDTGVSAEFSNLTITDENGGAINIVNGQLPSSITVSGKVTLTQPDGKDADQIGTLDNLKLKFDGKTDGVDLGTANITNGTGTFTHTITDPETIKLLLKDGNHKATITGTVTDVAGNHSEVNPSNTENATFTIEGQPTPTVTIGNVTENNTVDMTDSATVSTEITVNNLKTGEHVTSVSVTVNGKTLTLTDLSAGTTNKNVTSDGYTLKLENGKYILEAPRDALINTDNKTITATVTATNEYGIDGSGSGTHDFTSIKAPEITADIDEIPAITSTSPDNTTISVNVTGVKNGEHVTSVKVTIPGIQGEQTATYNNTTHKWEVSVPTKDLANGLNSNPGAKITATAEAVNDSNNGIKSSTNAEEPASINLQPNASVNITNIAEVPNTDNVKVTVTVNGVKTGEKVDDSNFKLFLDENSKGDNANGLKLTKVSGSDNTYEVTVPKSALSTELDHTIKASGLVVKDKFEIKVDNDNEDTATIKFNGNGDGEFNIALKDPAITEVFKEANGTQTGENQAGKTINDPTPIIKGTAVADGLVAVYDVHNGTKTLLGVTNADNSGNFTLKLDGTDSLSDGSHKFVAVNVTSDTADKTALEKAVDSVDTTKTKSVTIDTDNSVSADSIRDGVRRGDTLDTVDFNIKTRSDISANDVKLYNHNGTEIESSKYTVDPISGKTGEFTIKISDSTLMNDVKSGTVIDVKTTDAAGNVATASTTAVQVENFASVSVGKGFGGDVYVNDYSKLIEFQERTGGIPPIKSVRINTYDVGHSLAEKYFGNGSGNKISELFNEGGFKGVLSKYGFASGGDKRHQVGEVDTDGLKINFKGQNKGALEGNLNSSASDRNSDGVKDYETDSKNINFGKYGSTLVNMKGYIYIDDPKENMFLFAKGNISYGIVAVKLTKEGSSSGTIYKANSALGNNKSSYQDPAEAAKYNRLKAMYDVNLNSDSSGQPISLNLEKGWYKVETIFIGSDKADSNPNNIEIGFREFNNAYNPYSDNGNVIGEDKGIVGKTITSDPITDQLFEKGKLSDFVNDDTAVKDGEYQLNADTLKEAGINIGEESSNDSNNVQTIEHDIVMDGTEGNDTLNGTENKADIINGGDGNDTIDGKGGTADDPDIIHAGGGDDTIIMHDNTEVDGGAGKDTLDVSNFHSGSIDLAALTDDNLANGEAKGIEVIKGATNIDHLTADNVLKIVGTADTVMKFEAPAEGSNNINVDLTTKLADNGWTKVTADTSVNVDNLQGILTEARNEVSTTNMTQNQAQDKLSEYLGEKNTPSGNDANEFTRYSAQDGHGNTVFIDVDNDYLKHS